MKMDNQERQKVTDILLQNLHEKVMELGFETVPGNKYLARKKTKIGCNFIRFKRENNFSDWISIKVLLGFNHQDLFNVFDELADKKCFLTKPLYQEDIGAMMYYSDYEQMKSLRSRYNCFPLGTWEVRSRKELYKSKSIMDAIQSYAPEFFSIERPLTFFSSFPERIINENHKDFIKLQIIAANKIGNKKRVKHLTEYYKKRRNFDADWIVRYKDFSN